MAEGGIILHLPYSSLLEASQHWMHISLMYCMLGSDSQLNLVTCLSRYDRDHFTVYMKRGKQIVSCGLRELAKAFLRDEGYSMYV